MQYLRVHKNPDNDIAPQPSDKLSSHARVSIHGLKDGFAISRRKIEEGSGTAYTEHNHHTKVLHSIDSIAWARMLRLLTAACFCIAPRSACRTRPHSASVLKFLTRNNAPDAIGGDKTWASQINQNIRITACTIRKRTGGSHGRTIAQMHVNRSGRILFVAAHSHTPLHLPTR
jgi:hypothetical protein